MSIHVPPGRLSFAAYSTFQFAWDSTSLSALKECPRKYYYSILLSYRPRHESVHLTFGILIHRAIEFYHSRKAEGKSHEQALRLTILDAMSKSWDHEKDRPWLSDDANKNRWTFIRTVVWYLDHYQNDPAKVVHFPDGRPAVELSFRYDLGLDLEGINILLCGHLDRVVEFGKQYYVSDVKTSKNTINQDFFLKFNPDNQMTNYTVGGKVAFGFPVHGVIVDGVQVATEWNRFLRGFTMRTESQLEEWLRDTKYYITMAFQYSKADYWPMNDKACHNYGGCPYRDICSKGVETREKWLASGFVQQVWDPLKIRGDI